MRLRSEAAASIAFLAYQRETERPEHPALALMSRPNVAMTGEITLRGRILQIGGVREKVLAAHRAGMKVVMLPERSMKDLVDVPKRVRTDLKIIPVTHMDQVLEIALEAEPSVEPVRPRKRMEEMRARHKERGTP